MYSVNQLFHLIILKIIIQNIPCITVLLFVIPYTLSYKKFQHSRVIMSHRKIEMYNVR